LLARCPYGKLGIFILHLPESFSEHGLETAFPRGKLLEPPDGVGGFCGKGVFHLNNEGSADKPHLLKN